MQGAHSASAPGDIPERWPRRLSSEADPPSAVAADAEPQRCATFAYGEDERHAGRTVAEQESTRVAVPGLYRRGTGCESEHCRGRPRGTPDDMNAVAPLLRHAYG